MVTCPCCFGPVVAQHIMTGVHGRGVLFTSWQPGSKERGEGAEVPMSPFKNIPAVTSLPPIRPHLLKVLPPSSRAIGWQTSL